MSDRNGPSYRSEIDGLRAVAILAVLFYHVGLGVSGGYVGVDVFFVISGFLITSLILADLRDSRFSFLQFWERRARRIGPAMVVVVAVVLVAGWFILFPAEYRLLGKATVFQSFFSANIYSFLDSGYFDGASAEKPLLHTWSLAVEEQFYLIMPVLLWVLFRYKKTHPRRSILALLVALSVLSLVVAEAGLHWKASASFYLLPARAWELLVGSILVVIPHGGFIPSRPWLRETLSWLGLIAILVSCAVYTEKTPFPGFAALLPVLGTALFIHSNRRGDGAPANTYAARALSWRPVVFVGLISYSMYLWHWPILVFAGHLSMGPLGLLTRLFVVFLSFVAAILSWKFVEAPFRKKTLGRGRSVFLWVGVGLILTAAAGLALYVGDGLPQRFGSEVRSYISAVDDKSYRLELSVEQAKNGEFYRIGDPNPSKHPEVMVWGDSHAMAAMEAFHLYLAKNELAGFGATHSSTAPVLNWYRLSTWGLGSQAPEFADAVVNFALTHSIRKVFLVSMWEANILAPSINGITFSSALEATVKRLVTSNIEVYIMLDVPRTSVSVPKLLARSLLSGSDIAPYLTGPTTMKQLDGFDQQFLDRLGELGAKVANPKDSFLSSDRKTYVVAKYGKALYFDNHHLSREGARQIYLPFLERILEDSPTP